MTDKLQCSLYHELDGKCCPQGCDCYYDAPMKVISLDPDPLPQELVRMSLNMTCCVLAIIMACVGLYASVNMERHYKNRGVIEQEVTHQARL